MDTNAADPNARARLSLWKKWPLTTISAVGGLVSMAVLVAMSPAAAVDEPREPADLHAEEAPPADVDDAAATATHRGEEGMMGKPTRTSKSGLYAMKGPKDAVPRMARDFDPEVSARSAGILGAHSEEPPASPEGGAFAVGSDDADVWGGLTGTEVGEAYGVGGLGLVGLGGGGGTGPGYGRGSGAHAGSGLGRVGKYHALLPYRLTTGVVDDNADPAAYAKALKKLDGARAPLGIDDALWTMEPLAPRHNSRPHALDVALVIDTTGSMGDELEYLKVEIRDIAQEIGTSYPGVAQRWGLVVYRDHSDAYVTRSVDFADIDVFVDHLGKQSAGGGGDMPEAIDLALLASAGLSWQTDADTARMVFLVADAPSHPGAAARRYTDAVLQHRAAKTAIYAVAGSGVDASAEAELRLAAKVTGGQYIFLTDHSGVGDSHKEAEVDQFKVESLHDAMARMIRGELGGDRSDEAPIACDTPRVPDTSPAPAEVVVAAPAPAEPDLWDAILQRLAAHLLFASSMAVLLLAAIGADSLLRRRRERV